MDGTEISDLFSEHALVEDLSQLKIDRSDYYIICKGELLCDKHGKFAGYPQKNSGPTRREAQDAVVREKILQLKQLNFLKAKNEFIQSQIDQKAAENPKNRKKSLIRANSQGKSSAWGSNVSDYVAEPSASGIDNQMVSSSDCSCRDCGTGV